jgi:hypothetical protein
LAFLLPYLGKPHYTKSDKIWSTRVHLLPLSNFSAVAGECGNLVIKKDLLHSSENKTSENKTSDSFIYATPSYTLRAYTTKNALRP